ncbi:AAA domain-containing protein [Amycolatopsis sp. NPDC003676]
MTTPDEAVANILTDLRDASHRAIVVDSPPGAGKSTLVVRAARQLAEDDDQRMIVAQTNEQVDDLIDRLAGADPAMRIGRLSSTAYVTSERVDQHANVRVATKPADLADRTIVIGTAAKWATITDGSWSHAIIDEAYQMRSDMLLRIANRFDRGLFVGDPGQLDPFATVETARWAGLTWASRPVR